MFSRVIPPGPLGEAVQAVRRHLLAAAGFSALVNILFIVPTLYMLQVYDRVVPTRGLATLFLLTLILLFALGTLSLLDRVRMRLLLRAGVRLNEVLAPQILDASFGKPGSAEARQALRDFDSLRTALSGQAVIALFDAPWMPIYILICFILSPWIGLMALGGCVLLPWLAVMNQRSSKAKTEEAQRVAAQSHQLQDMAIGNAEAVRALGMRRALVARAMRQRESMLAAQSDAGFQGGNYLAVTKFVRLALQSLALGLGAMLAVAGKVSAGAIFASSFLIARALQPIEQLVGNWKLLEQALAALKSLDSLLADAPARREATRLPAPEGRLAVENLVIANEKRDGAILQGISIAVEKGEAVAIIGPSGAGKSTLVRAIAGAILPDRGAIRVDGANIADWEPEHLAPHFGYLPQSPSLFAGTIAENIARFAGETGMDKAALDRAVVEAAKGAHAHDMILGLAGGYDHPLGLGGTGLSAGQAQRIALARALFGRPAILVLDEPNAHLDTEGDAQLVATIGEMKAAGTTVLIVSHKMGILPVIDKILVLKDGRAAIYGPRAEVLAQLSPPAPARPGPAAAASQSAPTSAITSARVKAGKAKP